MLIKRGLYIVFFLIAISISMWGKIVEFKLDSIPTGSVLRKVTAQPQMIEGKMALRVELMDDNNSKSDFDDDVLPTFVQIPIEIEDGTIEVDIYARLNGKGPTDARAFVGLAYHVNADASVYESVYLRPLNGRKLNPPAPRDKRAVQYYAYPDWNFDRLRREYPDGRYEVGANIQDNEWITLKLELDGSRLKVFVNNTQVMDIAETKIAPTKGALGLWVDIGTEAWFSNLKVTSKK